MLSKADANSDQVRFNVLLAKRFEKGPYADLAICPVSTIVSVRTPDLSEIVAFPPPIGSAIFREFLQAISLEIQSKRTLLIASDALLMSSRKDLAVGYSECVIRCRVASTRL